MSSEPKPRSPFLKGLKTNVRGYVLRGLIAIVPLGITVYVMVLCFRFTAGHLAPIVQPEGYPMPAYIVVIMSIVLFLGVLFLVGVTASAVAGRRLIALIEAIIRRIPFVKTVYGASKQVVELFSIPEESGNYQAAVIVDFPHPGTKAFGFVVGKTRIEGDREYVRVFVPTTPNPTSGYLEFYSPEHIFGSTLSVEDSVRSVMSAGILMPENVDIFPITGRHDSSGRPREEISLDATWTGSPGKKAAPKLPIQKKIAVLIRKRLVSGILMMVPLAITVFVLRFLYDMTVGNMTPMTERFLGHLPPYAIHIATAVLFIAGLYALGIVTTAVVGKRLIRLAEWVIDRIPLVKTIYGASKQMVETFAFEGSAPDLRAAALVEFPYPGVKSMGFVTGIVRTKSGEEFLKVFMPTAPNITVGVVLLYKRPDVMFCDLSVEDAIKMVVSIGILAPDVLRIVPSSRAENAAASPSEPSL